MATTTKRSSNDTITKRVRERYSLAATAVQSGTTTASGCCGDCITGALYAADQAQMLPEDAVLASLGCGNPTALIDLLPGQVVLDLGSGGALMCC
jgi:arsenite methyltransferase